MDFVTALNVTIYGLGIVFLALLVVMFAIMVLSRIFALATGKDFLAVPVAAEESAPAEPAPSVKPVSAAASAPSAPALRPLASAPRPAPAPAPVAPTATKPAVGGKKITAPLPGKLLAVAVKPGDPIRKGQELCVIEAMKMANSVKAQQDGTILEVLVAVGDSVPFGTPLFKIE